MRTENVTVAGIAVTVRERKIKELKELAITLGINQDLMKLAPSAMYDKVKDLFYNQVSVIFPELKGTDLEEAYPSELENLVNAFLDVNFTGAKKVAIPLLSLAQKYLSSSPKN
jgi:hypothetical protein